jgi:cell division protein FtsB
VAKSFLVACPGWERQIQHMPRRIKQKPSLLAPAGQLLRRLSDADVRTRRRITRYSLWVIGLFFLYTLMSGTYGIPRIARLKIEKETLIEDSRQRLAELVDEVRVREMLKNDPVYIEFVARTEYYLARPNEIIYRYRGR